MSRLHVPNDGVSDRNDLILLIFVRANYSTICPATHSFNGSKR